jgi:hypothetical protein
MTVEKFAAAIVIPAPTPEPAYKSYVATLFQAGTFAPSPTVIKNDFTGVTFTWSYVAVGIYRITAGSPVFTNNKTAIFFQNDYVNLISWVMQINSTSQIQIYNAEWTGTFPAQVDSAMQAASFEIKVYN